MLTWKHVHIVVFILADALTPAVVATSSYPNMQIFFLLTRLSLTDTWMFFREKRRCVLLSFGAAIMKKFVKLDLGSFMEHLTRKLKPRHYLYQHKVIV